MSVSGHLRRVVVERSGYRCEYCGLAQVGQEATFHVDHVVPVIAGGQTTAENLALACVSCSLRKGALRIGLDPATGNDAPLFNPRQDAWSAHFHWAGVAIIGTSPTGRATVDALRLNRPLILAIREEESFRGRHPPRI
jgi:hypothetical protein